jgi:hypothetical protein
VKKEPNPKKKPAPKITTPKEDTSSFPPYRDIWFTFNDQYSWAQTAFEVKEGRISVNRTMQKDEVLAPMKEIMKGLAGEALLKVFEKYGIDIE